MTNERKGIWLEGDLTAHGLGTRARKLVRQLLPREAWDLPRESLCKVAIAIWQGYAQGLRDAG